MTIGFFGDRDRVAEMLAKHKSVTRLERFADLTPWGGGMDAIHFKTAEEAALYDQDPIGNAARRLGLTVDEYIDWIWLMGTPLCGGLTRSGRPCRKVVGITQSGADTWKRAHRKARCPWHGGDWHVAVGRG